MDRITDGKRHAEQYRQCQKIFSGNDAEPAGKAEYRTDTADGCKDRNEHSPHRTDEQNQTDEHDDKARDDTPFHIVLYRAAFFRFDVADAASFERVSVAFKFVRFDDRDRSVADFVHIRIIVIVRRQRKDHPRLFRVVGHDIVDERFAAHDKRFFFGELRSFFFRHLRKRFTAAGDAVFKRIADFDTFFRALRNGQTHERRNFIRERYFRFEALAEPVDRREHFRVEHVVGFDEYGDDVGVSEQFFKSVVCGFLLFGIGNPLIFVVFRFKPRQACEARKRDQGDCD